MLQIYAQSTQASRLDAMRRSLARPTTSKVVSISRGRGRKE